MAGAYEEVFGFEVSVDDASRVEVEQRVDDVRTHSTGRAFVEFHTLRDRIEQISTLATQKQTNFNKSNENTCTDKTVTY